MAMKMALRLGRVRAKSMVSSKVKIIPLHLAEMMVLLNCSLMVVKIAVQMTHLVDFRLMKVMALMIAGK